MFSKGSNLNESNTDSDIFQFMSSQTNQNSYDYQPLESMFG